MKNTKNLVVLSRLQAENLNPGSDWAVISITNPKQSPATLDGGAAVLRLGFYDVEQILDNFESMSAEDARAVLDFVQKYGDKHVLVHCEQGRSRSVAVALFLAGWLKRTISVEPELANKLVLRRLHMEGLRYAVKHLQVRRAAYCGGLLDYAEG